MNITFDSMFSFVYQTGSGFNNFSHDTHELIYFITGEGSTIINGINYYYTANNICFTQIGDVRDHMCTKKTKYICIRFLNSDNQFNLKSGVYPCNSDGFLSLFLDISNEHEHKHYKYYDMCNLLISEILIKLSRLSVIDNKESNIYRLIKEIDNSNLYNKSIKEMAMSVSYSYDHFRHKFKEITGQSPTNYIINRRIENACKLLLLNKYSCTEISMLCGFSSSSQFSTLFKKAIGITPKQYQKLHIN